MLRVNLSNKTFSSCCEWNKEYLKISDVGEEEADEGEGQKPFRDCADNVSRVTLKEKEDKLECCGNTKWRVFVSQWEQFICSELLAKIKDLLWLLVLTKP